MQTFIHMLHWARSLKALAQKSINRDRGAEQETRICPECGHKMVKGQLSGGYSHGRAAWGCTNYPECTRLIVERTPAEERFLQEMLRNGRGKRKRRR